MGGVTDSCLVQSELAAGPQAGCHLLIRMSRKSCVQVPTILCFPVCQPVFQIEMFLPATYDVGVSLFVRLQRL